MGKFLPAARLNNNPKQLRIGMIVKFSTFSALDPLIEDVSYFTAA
jgi:hypothetical protein